MGWNVKNFFRQCRPCLTQWTVEMRNGKRTHKGNIAKGTYMASDGIEE